MKDERCLLFKLTVSTVLMCLVFSGCGRQSAGSGAASKLIGEHMKFGTYQGEEIEWRVIDADDENGKVLLLSEYGLDAKPYNDEFSFVIKWEDCTLRKWLNEEFYEDAFTDEEQEKILLSTSEGFPDTERLCYPTEYAKNNTDIKIYNDACGWWLCAGSRGGYNGERRRPYVVSVHGGISQEEKVDSSKYAVRPAMWIEL